jgi:hypothetical protein
LWAWCGSRFGDEERKLHELICLPVSAEVTPFILPTTTDESSGRRRR